MEVIAEKRCGVEQRVAHQAHNLEVVGSNPTPAIWARFARLSDILYVTCSVRDVLRLISPIGLNDRRTCPVFALLSSVTRHVRISAGLAGSRLPAE